MTTLTPRTTTTDAPATGLTDRPLVVVRGLASGTATPGPWTAWDPAGRLPGRSGRRRIGVCDVRVDATSLDDAVIALTA